MSGAGFRILLINPPYGSQVSTTTRDVHLAMERKPPLGILSIGTYLKRFTDFKVRLLDDQLEILSEFDLRELIKDFKPNIIGITVVSFKLNSAFQITQTIKNTAPEVHVCWGGPHLSIYPRESLRLPGVDSIILGDGEVPFTEVCRRLREGKKVDDIEGVYTKSAIEKDLVFREFFHPDLDILPFPDLNLLPYKKYRAFLTNKQMATVITSRGCPHRCIFCKLSHSKLRLLSVNKVLDMIENYLSLGIKEIEFYDETFNINVKRVMEFAQGVIDRGLKFRWAFRGRVNAVSLEMLELIKKAGCQRILYGVEAGTDRVLKILRKETDVETIRRCFSLTNKAGIDTVAYLILSSPGETMEEMRETIKLTKELNPTYIEYAIFNIAPGTESYSMALKEGLLREDIWRGYALNPIGPIPELVWEKDIPLDELQRLRRMALREFYLRPSYLMRKILSLRFSEALQIFKTGLGVLKEILPRA